MTEGEPRFGMAAHGIATPDKPALRMGNANLTYGALAERSRSLAAAFRDRGVPSDGTGAIAAMLPNGFEFFETAAAAFVNLGFYDLYFGILSILAALRLVVADAIAPAPVLAGSAVRRPIVARAT